MKFQEQLLLRFSDLYALFLNLRNNHTIGHLVANVSDQNLLSPRQDKNYSQVFG